MNNTGRIVRWVASGGSFLAGVLLTGCGTLPFGQRQAAVPPLPATRPAAEAAPAPSRPMVNVINAFGEFPIARPSGAPMGADQAMQQHTACDEGYDADVTLDPSGRLMVFSSTRHSERSSIYLQRIDGSAVVQLTNDPADNAQPAFSPDGKHIAFASTRSGSWDIYIMDAEGKNTRQITESAGQEMHPSFSPDGTRLVYSALSPRGDQWELWTIDLNTHERRMIGHGLFPAWSPDKTIDRIAFQRPRQRGSRMFSIWTVDLEQGEPRRLTEIAVSGNAAAVCPAWSGDGSRIAFTTIVPDGERSRQDVWLVNADGTGRRRLTDGAGTNLAPCWGVDNRVFFVSNRGGHENIWSVRAGAGSAVLAKDNAAPGHAAPQPTAVGSTGAGDAGH